ncbi:MULTISPECIES: PHB depolymerase family esterase [unclassified Halomonas]|uniref:PHB depolymerase family esterase n=1 Tax=unclassified Halomonas TaxID=2609666 RepID=UPI00209D0811|nr:poly(3-hydroxybutyrate) depolymerase [Halomonas sp. 707D7]MCP1326896.1 poly(3-hydroxybutyrate) depolymerase [Halomonas sp. 707D4]
MITALRPAFTLRRLIAALLLLGGADAFAETPALPALGAAQEASVVGVSSGGYMAAQLAVAWPERFTGLGLVAAGPWGCAQGTLSLALRQCMSTRQGLPSLEALDERLASYRAQGLAGDEAALERVRVYVRHGDDDEVVSPELGALSARQWRNWAGPEAVRSTHAAHGHGWPVRLDDEESLGPYALGGCRQGGGSYMLACDDDMAGEMLDWLYPGRAPAPSKGALVPFDQAEFAVKGLADTGYLFVPEQCRDRACPVTLALHGCQMSATDIGDVFVRYSGLNRWAAEHAQLVLYPQAQASLANPQGCWDWWGFAESAWQPNPHHDTRDGVQARALMAMLDRLETPGD